MIFVAIFMSASGRITTGFFALPWACTRLPLAAALEKQIGAGRYDRIILTGMGSSFNAAYPTVIRLCGQPLPVQFVNAAELLHETHGMISPRSLLWINSQSGRSAEIVQLLNGLTTRPPASILAFVNDASSPLASRADSWLEIHAGAEASVSTKTYINMLAANLLAAVQLTGGDLEPTIRDLQLAAGAIETYLKDWQTRLDEFEVVLGEFDQLVFLGRGASMSAVWNGSLINKEAARSSFEGMHAADFRHGPLELVSSGFVAVIFAGSHKTADLNRRLALDIIAYGGRVLWVDSVLDHQLSTVLLPQTSELARPLMEILPMQILILVMAKRKGLEAGLFRHVGKITATE